MPKNNVHTNRYDERAAANTLCVLHSSLHKVRVPMNEGRNQADEIQKKIAKNATASFPKDAFFLKMNYKKSKTLMK